MLLSSAFIRKLHKVRSAEPRLTKWQSAAVVLAVGGVLALWIFWTATWPVPRGRDNRNHAGPFLKAAFPDRPLTADFAESSTAPVAAVFQVIRRGSPDEAANAIAFAGEQEFGFSTLGLHLVGGFETCTWGETQIAYYSDHGIVLGLEDARTGGFGLWLLLVAAWLVGPFAAVLLWECLPNFISRRSCL